MSLNATAESVDRLLLLKNLEKHFCNLTFKKNFVKHIENLPQHLSEKFIDIAYRNLDLSIIVIAHGFFLIIDYRFSTERFNVRTMLCLYAEHLYTLMWLHEFCYSCTSLSSHLLCCYVSFQSSLLQERVVEVTELLLFA